MNSAPMNSAVRKIHNLLSSGAVTVTGPNQPRILKQKITTNAVVGNNLQQQVGANRCYVCDDALSAGQAQHMLSKMATSHTATKFPNKIGHLVGEAYTVIICAEDVVCARCTNLINYLDRLENDVERVRSNLINLLHRKYGLNDDGGGGDVSPPKMQKLNSGATVIRATANDDGSGGGGGASGISISEVNRTRKIVQMSSAADSPLGKQSPPVSAVQQIKISTQPAQQTPPQQLNALQNTQQTMQRKTTRIYKCLTCEYKTSDMRLFNTHYETCKQQNFQCKNCKKIFPNFGTMKQHMVREHNTSMDNTCSVCHINFVSEGSLRKHMELNHSTNVVVTTTVPMSAVVNEVSSPVTGAVISPTASATTPLYACTHCQFKTTDKQIHEEHMRKHASPGKPKPFKCRLCSQRFETRDAATIHAKQHQPNYFKCGTCSLSFSKREQLVKHFEVHQQQNVSTGNVVAAAAGVQQHNVQQTMLSPNTTKQLTPSPASQLTTQKLLQETIDEALSDNVTPTPASGQDTAAATASNIRFYSCNVCSLTFLQENYYNQHMETHRRDEKKSTTGGANNTGASRLNALSNNSNSGVTIKKGDNGLTNAQQVDANSAEADIESIFEKMHSDKSDADTISTATTGKAGAEKSSRNERAKTGAGQDNLVITSQEGSGGITFNITIPEAATGTEATGEPPAKKPATSIDMPTLDQPDELASSLLKTEANEEHIDENDEGKSKVSTAAPVSMPSLDDDGETAEQQAAEADAATNNAASKPASGRATPNESKIKTDPTENVKTETKTEQDAGADNNEDEPEEHIAEHKEKAHAEANAEHQQQAAAAESGLNAAELEHAEASGETEGLSAEQHHHLAGEHHQQVAMELDEAMQAQVESGQIKFILNENGQLLQLDNHIITDAEGNQILVQDPEQIQQLLQSVGVLQSGDAIDGETLQMMTDNGQMVLVQGENNETQLIDASLLNAEGQLVIQQGQDGELGEGTHVISEDGTRIPVSVSYTADGQPIVQVQQVLSTGGATDAENAATLEEKVAAATGEAASHNDAGDVSNVVTATSQAGVVTTTASGSSSGGFFALEDLMQQQQQHNDEEGKAAE